MSDVLTYVALSMMQLSMDQDLADDTSIVPTCPAEAFLPPRPSCRRPRRGAPTARRSATEQPRDDESGRNPLKEPRVGEAK